MHMNTLANTNGDKTYTTSILMSKMY